MSADAPEDSADSTTVAQVAVKIGIIVVAVGLVTVGVHGGVFADLQGVGLRSVWLPWFGTVILTAFALRVVLWLVYRATPTADRAGLPTLTVVIPAFNEGPGVRDTINSILASDYPADRLRIIAVNDGSTDDTGAHIDRAAAAAPDRVTAIHLAQNSGKRHAVYRGFKEATSTVIATVDSDSIVPPKSLANLVSPLLCRPRVAAVAGKVLALNRRKNLLTRMLGVRYILGFDFVRAYQSVQRTVWCCPGALQAYRRSVVAPHLERWRDQRFLGARCTNGDDHAMTNLVLSLGHDSYYQSSATVLTLVPETYKQLTRMYTRWGRSATREGLRALAFTFPRMVRLGPIWGPLMALDALLQPVTIALRVLGFFAAIYLVVAHPWWFLKAAVGTTLVAVAYALIFLRSEQSTDTLYGILYAWFALFALPWVQPWATATVRRNGWLTRG